MLGMTIAELVFGRTAGVGAASPPPLSIEELMATLQIAGDAFKTLIDLMKEAEDQTNEI